VKKLIRKLHYLMGRDRQADELAEEMEFHRAMAEREGLQEGLAPRDAVLRARRQMGNETLAREEAHYVWYPVAIEGAVQDIRYAWSGLLRSPGFSLTVIALVAVGVGVNGTVFSLFRGIMHRPLAGVAAENLVSLGVAADGREGDPANSWQNYVDYRESSETLSQITARGFERFVLAVERASYRIRGSLVTADYFDTLGVRLATGRAFSVNEDANEFGLEVVISHRVWQEQFESSEDVLDAILLLNG
jgi:hypothetical protein